MKVPNRQNSITEKVVWTPNSGGRFTLFLTMNYVDDTPVGVFVDCIKIGTILRDNMRALAMVTSKSLQSDISFLDITEILMDSDEHSLPYVIGSWMREVHSQHGCQRTGS